MSEQKIAEIRGALEKHEIDGREIVLSPQQVRFLLSELDKRDEENHKFHRKMIAQRQTTGTLQKKADKLEKENRKLREELKEAREEIKGLDEMVMH